MSTGILEDAAGRERLSALVDGELGRVDVVAACAAWSADAEARRTWHAWHLIGDALRSEDPASDPKGDAAFCAAVRTRLATEAVVLAPVRRSESADAGRATRFGGPWRVGSAVAAGLLLVVGTFTLVRTGDEPAPERLALADRPVGAAPVASATAVRAADVAAPEVAVVADQQLIRDARLDRYLAAHKQFAGSSALGVPSAFLRSATVESASR